ncbi:surface-adhesin E family protein [Trinickia dinghuensis]|uniref:surface-adhesin E family protein n=1 Tax=Trinickia dinghuensis TaxID=2291023 RepID=UPI0011C06B33|nr:surface-adhesin E family protein [Trinickia dinghuensis]
MLRNLLVMMAVITSTSRAYGADWLLAYKDRDGQTDYDRATMVRTGSIVKVWTRTDFMPPKRVAGFRELIGRMVTREIVDCSSRTPATGQETLFDGHLQAVFTWDGDPVFREVSPDSNGAALVMLMCD